MNLYLRSKRTSSAPNPQSGVPTSTETIMWEQFVAIFPLGGTQRRDDAADTDVTARFTAYVRNPNFDVKPGDLWCELQAGTETGLMYRVVGVTPYPTSKNIEIVSVEG